MNQRLIGIVLVVIGILVALFVHQAKANDDDRIMLLIEAQGGSCYLEDGTCLHEDRDMTIFIFGWVLSSALIILGLYLILFDKTQQVLAKQHLEVSSALKEAKKKESKDSRWNAFLAGFEEDQKNVLSAIKEQDGIKQSTLRFRTGISKSSLSLLLKDLEKKGFISRKISGKTNQVFLRKKF